MTMNTITANTVDLELPADLTTLKLVDKSATGLLRLFPISTISRLTFPMPAQPWA